MLFTQVALVIYVLFVPGKPAQLWAEYKDFDPEYEQLIEMLFEDFGTPQALANRQAEIRSRLKKKEHEASLSVRQEEMQTATPASTDAKVKCEAEPELSQRKTEVTQLNTYATAASEIATDKSETTAEKSKAAVKKLDDNDSSTDAIVALATSKAAEDEKPLDKKHDASVDETQEEEPKQSTAAVEEESLAKTENDVVGKQDGIPEGRAGELKEQVPELRIRSYPRCNVTCDQRNVAPGNKESRIRMTG
ncbi:hypothetical protein FQA39_LY14104 [Lamprigera yunnana]|nr:hypothetical protein FQA39_LY14104 [Lamprigera yunnana]